MKNVSFPINYITLSVFFVLTFEAQANWTPVIVSAIIFASGIVLMSLSKRTTAD